MPVRTFCSSGTKVLYFGSQEFWLKKHVPLEQGQGARSVFFPDFCGISDVHFVRVEQKKSGQAINDDVMMPVYIILSHIYLVSEQITIIRFFLVLIKLYDFSKTSSVCHRSIIVLPNGQCK